MATRAPDEGQHHRRGEAGAGAGSGDRCAWGWCRARHICGGPARDQTRGRCRQAWRLARQGRGAHPWPPPTKPSRAGARIQLAAALAGSRSRLRPRPWPGPCRGEVRGGAPATSAPVRPGTHVRGLRARRKPAPLGAGCCGRTWTGAGHRIRSRASIL